MPHGPEDLRRPDAPSTLELALENTRSGSEAIRRGGGIFGSTQFAAECEALRVWAEQAGCFNCFEPLSRKPHSFGYEHEVWFPTEANTERRVTKATYGNCFGHLPDGTEATPSAYLERLLLCNAVFGDQIVLLGVQETGPGVIRVVTEQPAVHGHPAEPDEIITFFTLSGFIKCRWKNGHVWLRPQDSIVASDTHGGNVLRTADDSLVAIDVPLMKWTSDMPKLEAA